MIPILSIRNSLSRRLSSLVLIAGGLIYGFTASVALEAQQAASTEPQTPATASAPQNPSPQSLPEEPQPQTKRILGILPNFRAVSTDEKLPPETVKEKFMNATQDSFDYSSIFLPVALAGYSMGTKATPEFHQGAAGYARYFWHAAVDQTSENYMVEFIFPIITREDARYYTLGRGGFVKRTGYAFSRAVVTRSNSGTEVFNVSEIVGAGVASGLSSLYYPSRERSFRNTGTEWGLDIGIDAASFWFREFWPDINHRIFHNKYGTDTFTTGQLPKSPQPQIELAATEQPNPNTLVAQNHSPQLIFTPPQPSAVQDSSSSQTPAQQPPAAKSQYEKAEEQIKEEEKQRIVGVVPAFNVSYHSDAVSMTAGQKMRLAFRSSIDPVTFAAGFLAAGYHEAKDDDKGFGWGPEGYGKRAGAAYLDAFNGTMIGNGILPSILHQDPRYFRLGHGTVGHRLLYSLATNVICPHDNTHKWEPNYSNVGGNIIAGAISNLYYPSSNAGVSQTFTTGFIVTAEGGLASIFNEFWPDISRKVLHRDPTHGLDAQARDAYQEKKNVEKPQ